MFATTIQLNSSREGSAVYLGDTVVFTCTVTGPGILQWAVQSINRLGDNSITFSVIDTPGVVRPDPYPEVLNVTLVSASQSTDHPLLGNLTSQITVPVTPNTVGKLVYCSDGRHSEDEAESIAIMACKRCYL